MDFLSADYLAEHPDVDLSADWAQHWDSISSADSAEGSSEKLAADSAEKSDADYLVTEDYFLYC